MAELYCTIRKITRLVLFLELGTLRKYNNYRSMCCDGINIQELLGEARAIHFAMSMGQITYEQAKTRVQPILRRVNDHVEHIAKACKVKPKYIKFQDLGRNL